jgi:hypothetical protein
MSFKSKAHEKYLRDLYKLGRITKEQLAQHEAETSGVLPERVGKDKVRKVKVVR